MILAWWHVHVSDRFSSCCPKRVYHFGTCTSQLPVIILSPSLSDLLFSKRCHSFARLLLFLDTFAVHIPHPVCIRSSVSAGDVIYVPCCYSFLIHSSFVGCILCRIYTLFIYHIHSSLKCYTHSSLHSLHLSLVHMSDSVSIYGPVIFPFDLSFSYVKFICQTHLRSCISHWDWSLLDLFFSLTSIKFQDS